ncbi:MAG: leucyl/phenylalanyl-tRNA--protein transferase [Arcticibacterium sp.]|jgi:leucyl/phenylalanyl-tRNA--protein transferase
MVSDLLYAYVNGLFPMADESGEIGWYAPDPRAIIPIDTYKPSKSLRPVLNKEQFDIEINKNFTEVMRQCSLPRFKGDGIWISNELIDMYTQLHDMGFAHSVEAYEAGELVGGLYGVSVGGAFFGESMFHKVSNASKVAFHFLVERLRDRNFGLLDTQFINDNVLRYGAIEIPKEDYTAMLGDALALSTGFVDGGGKIALE